MEKILASCEGAIAELVLAQKVMETAEALIALSCVLPMALMLVVMIASARYVNW